MMRALTALVVLCLCLFTPMRAQALDIAGTGFDAIPVLHEGRLKPMDSFARAMHWRITGREHPAQGSATQWLAQILFDPLEAAEMPQFTVRNHELSALLSLPDKDGGLYSFTDISAALAPHITMIGTLAQQDKLSPAQEQLLQLQKSVIDYTQLMRSLSLILPLSVTLPGMEGDDYLSLRRHEEQVQKKLDAIMKRKGDDIERYTDEERQTAAFAFQLAVIRDSAQGNEILRVIPAPWKPGEWLSPWAVIQSGQGSPETGLMMRDLKDMTEAWRFGDRETFTGAAAGLGYKTLPADRTRLETELAYNKAALFSWAMGLYGGALLLALLALRRARLVRPAFLLGAAGVLAHGAALALRVYILERPPVGTLYESVLFVALIAVATALVAGRRNPALLAAGFTSGAGLLFMAPLLIRGGDTMPVLVAVLNTNFWLATHVIIITAGYGFSILCGLAAHIWLAGAALGKPQSSTPMHRLALLALLFTTIGTILGGIWADQSWGRFWGWDPKENGALLIVLWLVWAMHGRRASLLRPALYAVALAGVNIIVALAWFGVNLLNVGLHSYGFTSGIALALAVFCAVEAALIAALWYKGAHRERAA